MDIARITASPALDTPEALRDAVLRLADQQAIRDLAAIYSLAVDGHDLDTVIACFAEDGSFERAANVNRGHETLRIFYQKMMDRYATTLHTVHSHVIDVAGNSAIGILTGHGELVLGRTLMMAAYRYDDTYSRIGGRWVFATRSLRFMYVVPFEAMGTSFGDQKRIRWPELAFTDADIPESLPTWEL